MKEATIIEAVEEDVVFCYHCGGEISMEDAVEMDDAYLCPGCADRHTLICSECGERIWATDCIGEDDIILCESCYEDHYTRCAHCNRLIDNGSIYYLEDDEEETPYCYDCYQHLRDDLPIHEYSYKPKPLFYGGGTRFFGVELEIDGAGKRNGNAQEILTAANECAEHIYIKSDSSLDDGMEIVTHPMTLAYHLGEMPWGRIADTALQLGYHSHKTCTCGLHIHINRTAFGDSREEQEDCIAHLLYLVEKFWGELLRFSRRTEHSLKRWAARYGMKERPSEILDTAKKGCGGRYVCVNLQNRDTIEIRIFRGTLKRNTIYATLQLVNRLCDVAISLSEEELESFSWTEFVECVREAELLQYLKERRLYLNEPVSTEEEE